MNSSAISRSTGQALLLSTFLVAAAGHGLCDPGSIAPAEGQDLVELRELPGERVKEGCVVGRIDADGREIFEVVRRAELFPAFMPHVVSSTVETVDSQTSLNTQELNLPFPLRDRHFTIRVVEHEPTAFKDPRRWQLVWEYVEGSGNVVENAGSWTIEERAPGESVVAYFLRTDPGGAIPGWAVKRATEKTLPAVFESVRQRVRELRGTPNALGE